MMMLRGFAAIACACACSAIARASSDVNEALAAKGLIGDHFGVPGLNASFDYVIVGGGTAGLALARRLASNASNSVAVVDAGDFYEFANGNYTEIPADASMFVGSNPVEKNPFLDWYQYTTRQQGLADRSMLFPSGKVLGGSSARNFMWYQRSSKGSYQKWADLTGDSSWAWDNLLQYFQRSAHFHEPENSNRFPNSSVLYDLAAYIPSGGPLQVGYPSWVNPISSWLGAGLSAIGLQQINGMVSGNILGWTFTAFTIDPTTQTRSSSEASYLREALTQTTNLFIYKNTMGKQIVFDTNKNALGVNVKSGPITYMLNASKEVIVSCGAFRSPQLLMASGIGPRSTLESQNIPVLSDRPGIGQNMWDHIAFSPAYAVNVITHSALAYPPFPLEQAQLYNTNRTGILTNPGGDILGFEKLPEGYVSPAIRAELDALSPDWPDVEHLFLDGYFGYANDSSGAPTDGRNYVSSSCALTNPFSRGNVTISSPNTEDYPVVNPNWLLDPRDQEVAVAAFKRAREVLTQPQTQSVLIGEEVFPGLNTSSDDQILNLIAQSAASSYHASCTCAMGMANDSMAVLDSKARVLGVQRLRVIDASAFPVLPPGHPSSTVYALAEKLADDIMFGR